MKQIKPNSGASIKGVANVILVLGIILSIAVGILVLVLTIQVDEAGIGFVAGAIIACVGSYMSWVSTLFIRGYGELVEYTAENATYLEAIEKSLNHKPKAKAPKAEAKSETEAVEIDEIWSDESVDTLRGMCRKALKVKEPVEAQKLCNEMFSLWEGILEEADAGNIDLSDEERDDIEAQMSAIFDHFIDIGYDPYSETLTK